MVKVPIRLISIIPPYGENYRILPKLVNVIFPFLVKVRIPLSAEEVIELRKRLEYLEAENAYLKKLAALVQQRKAQEQKKK